ncbi:DUF2165 family protein [Burkholderia pyrrocinia]|nr:DUF2165 family protein [Burkholderia pyrrocinia]
MATASNGGRRMCRIRLLRARRANDAVFRAARSDAITDQTVGFLTWQAGFMSVGGEWFGMGMSKQWTGMPNAFRVFITLLLVLVHLPMHNDGVDETRVAR